MAISAAEWPQWRGPGGRGVAAAGTALPTRWDPESPHLRWATTIPGEGHSSPIVVDGKVFVTTAYEGSRAGLAGWVLPAAVLGLGLWLAVGLGRAGRWRERRTLTIISALFLAGAVAITLLPDAFYSIDEPAKVWRATAGLALVGLATAAFWLAPGTRWRAVAIAALVAAAAWFAWQTPSGPGGPPGVDNRLVVALPALVALAIFLRARLRRGSRPPVGRLGGAANALPLVLLAMIVFVPPNLLRGELRAVVALDLDSGKILWERTAMAARPEQKWSGASYANPTPATDGERVFAYYGAGLAAFDFDGRLLWLRRFPEFSRYTRYGAAASPVVAGDAVLVVQERESNQDGPPSWIAAFDGGTGETVWRINPDDAKDSYNTPMVVPGGDAGPLLLTASWQRLVGYDAGSGERLWALDFPMMQVVASMARDGDKVAVAGGAYGDKKLLVAGLGESRSTAPRPLWESDSAVPRVPSPVFADGRLFTLTDGGVLTAYNAEKGRQLWRLRLDGDYFASLLAGDGKLYAVDTAGATSVVAVADEPELLAVNDLGEPVYATPAAAGGCLLLRTVERLYCFEAESAAAPEPRADATKEPGD